MQDWVEKLLRVQDLDLRIAKLSKLASSVPAKQEEAENMLASDNRAVDEAKAELLEAEVERKKIDLDMDGHKQKKTDFQAKSAMIKNNEEYRAAMSQIEKCDHQIEQCEEHREGASAVIEEIKRKQLSLNTNLSATKMRVEDKKKDLDVRAANCRAELEKLRAERPSVIGEVDRSWANRYERLRKRLPLGRKDQKVLVPVRNEVCDGCRMNATAQVRMNARKGMLVGCEYCGAMLYTDD
ncbi:MAG: hypothetical protein KAI66_10570 [Lentisphaeria bacterium]|nr:hypothetical protein [Lentisphaeria bacterium]